MQYSVIVSKLANRLSMLDIDPMKTIFSISLSDIMPMLIQRLGKETLTLNEHDLLLLIEELQENFQHNCEYKDLVLESIDCWEISRKL
jgi:hypothetical protein